MTAVVLPGSGSDDVFVRAAFAGPLRALGIDLVAPVPRPGPCVVTACRTALDGARARVPGPLLVGGVSLGAHVAARWAADRGAAGIAGLLLALPAWTGPAGAAPAARAARARAAKVRAHGL
ncbi:MAG: alpha/beta hydrolase, partial [Pseudonocardia sp.]